MAGAQTCLDWVTETIKMVPDIDQLHSEITSRLLCLAPRHPQPLPVFRTALLDYTYNVWFTSPSLEPISPCFVTPAYFCRREPMPCVLLVVVL